MTRTAETLRTAYQVISNVEPTAQSLARTYSDRVYPDPWEKVEDYRRVQEYLADHPNAGRTKVGHTLELPPSRVRGWIKDAVPDSVRAINTAIGRGWLAPEPESQTAAALTKLAGHILAGGSINQNWVPAVSCGSRASVEWIEQAFQAVGVATSTRNADSDSRATEVVPTEDSSVLGRCLSCLGVPRGSKRELDALPSAFEFVPSEARRAIAVIIVRHRGVEYDDKATTRVMSERPRAYHDSLAVFIRDATGERAVADDRGVTVSADAMRQLGLAHD